MKQSRIEELEVLLGKARSESAPRAEIQKLAEEKVQDNQALVRRNYNNETKPMFCSNVALKLIFAVIENLFIVSNGVND